MSRISTLVMLPSPVRDRMDDHLRMNGYGNLNHIVSLLRQEDVQVSRSALHRYALALRTADVMAGRWSAAAALAKKSRSKRDSLDLMMRRLEGLHAAQAELFGAIVREVRRMDIAPRPRASYPQDRNRAAN